jgi:hypothetical protein
MRYQGEIGDLVVGRITEVASKRWKVDLRGFKVRITTGLPFFHSCLFATSKTDASPYAVT